MCERSAPARWHWSNVRYCSERGANRNDYRDATMVLVAYRHESTPCATANCRRTLRQVRKPGYSSVVMAECSREGTLVRTVLAQASDLSADSAGAYPALSNGISRQTTYFRTRTASPPLCPAANGGWLPSTNAARADSAASVRHMLTHTTDRANTYGIACAARRHAEGPQPLAHASRRNAATPGRRDGQATLVEMARRLTQPGAAR